MDDGSTYQTIDMLCDLQSKESCLKIIKLYRSYGHQEATSSLNTKSERLIQYAIENIAKKTTVIEIAHRLSTIINADHIYVLEDGEVVEEGTYSELIRNNGRFYRMAKLQNLY